MGLPKQSQLKAEGSSECGWVSGCTTDFICLYFFLSASSSCTQQLPGSFKPNKALPRAKSPLPVAPSLCVAGFSLLSRQFLDCAGRVFGKRILQSCKPLLLESCVVRRCCWKGSCGMLQALASSCILPRYNHPPSFCPTLVMLLETCSFHTIVHQGTETPPNVPSLRQVPSWCTGRMLQALWDGRYVLEVGRVGAKLRKALMLREDSCVSAMMQGPRTERR